jgi:heat shock protein HtpX
VYSLFQYQIEANKRRTFFLFFGFILLITGLGLAIGLFVSPQDSVLFAAAALVLAVIMSISSYYGGASSVIRMTRAREVTKAEFPYLINTVEGLCIAAGLPHVPRVYVMDEDSPNAFATGHKPENSIICVTTGLLERLDRQQLEGVLAHELSHIYNQDILIMTVAAALVGLIIIICELVLRGRMWYFGGRGGGRDRGGGQFALIYLAIMLLAAILAPIVAQMMQMAISRNREHLADATAVKLTRNPEGLAGALEVIANTLVPMPQVSTAAAHLFIDDPTRAAPQRNWFERMFDTHPDIWDRIDKIRRM